MGLTKVIKHDVNFWGVTTLSLCVPVLRTDETFLEQIIRHLSTHGIINKNLLFKAPFTNVHGQRIFGVFDDTQVTNVIKLIDSVNDNTLESGMRLFLYYIAYC